MSSREEATSISDTVMGNPSINYEGYAPLHANDFIFDVGEQDPSSPDAGLTTQNGAPKKMFSGKSLSLALLVVAGIFFISTISISIFGQECKLSLCEKLDRSSVFGTQYKNTVLEFVAPLKFAWLAFAVSLLGAVMFSVYAFLLLKVDGITSNFRTGFSLISQTCRGFLFKEYRFLLVLLLMVFIVPAVSQLWEMAGCFLLGAAFAVLLGIVTAGVSSRGSLTTASVAQDSVHDCLSKALRTGSLVGVASMSIGLAGLAICYLLFRDVRALLGFALGASLTAFFTQVAGGLFTKAANAGFDCMHNLELGDDDRRNPTKIARSVGEILGNVSGMAAGVMSSYIIAIVATAVLGSALPYIYQNPYAVCVLNHLDLDRSCVSYKMPGKKNSFAASLCRFEDFYKRYPSLDTWQSNSLFVALPFILGIVGVLVSAIGSIGFFIPKTIAVPDSRESKASLLKKVLWRLRINAIVSTLLTVICSAIICWVMFGENSAFQARHSSAFDRYALQPLNETNAISRCRPVAAPEGSAKTGLPDLRMVRGPFRPINTVGKQFPNVSQVPWRMFLCISIGCALGLAVGAFTDAFHSFAQVPIRERVETLDNGRGALTADALGMSMLSTFLPIAAVVTSVTVASALFGTYGVGLSALGFLCCAGSIMTFDALKPITVNAKTVSQSRLVPVLTWKTAEVANVIARSASATVRGISSGGAVLSTFSLLAVLMQESGLIPSSRQLVGALTGQSPTKHISDVEDINVLDLYVFLSLLLGILLPFLLSAFILLSGNHATLEMISETAKMLRNLPSSPRDEPDMRPAHAHCIKVSTETSLMNVFLPVGVAVLAPLFIGFGFGTRSLVSFAIGSVSSAFLLSVAFNHAGAFLAAARSFLEHGYRRVSSSSSPWLNAVRTGDALGISLTDCCEPSLLAAARVIATLGTVAVPLMRPDGQKGWIGLVLVAGALAAAAAAAMAARRRRKAQAPELAAKGEASGPPTVNKDFVSPFYEEGPAVKEAQISALSSFAQFRDTYSAVGYDATESRWVQYGSGAKGFHRVFDGWDGRPIELGEEGLVLDPEKEAPRVEHIQVNL